MEINVQADDIFEVELTGAELVIVFNSLRKHEWGEVDGLMDKLIKLIQK